MTEVVTQALLISPRNTSISSNSSGCALGILFSLSASHLAESLSPFSLLYPERGKNKTLLVSCPLSASCLKTQCAQPYRKLSPEKTSQGYFPARWLSHQMEWILQRVFVFISLQCMSYCQTAWSWKRKTWEEGEGHGFLGFPCSGLRMLSEIPENVCKIPWECVLCWMRSHGFIRFLALYKIPQIFKNWSLTEENICK